MSAVVAPGNHGVMFGGVHDEVRNLLAGSGNRCGNVVVLEGLMVNASALSVGGVEFKSWPTHTSDFNSGAVAATCEKPQML